VRNQIIQGSVLDPETWAGIPDQHVQTCITSPPYWSLRDYGVEGQLGLEPTLEEFVERMVDVFRHVWRVLRDDGTLWLNLGDSYAHSGACGGGSPDGPRKSRETDRAKQVKMNYKIPDGLKPKDLCGIPWRVALALQADGAADWRAVQSLERVMSALVDEYEGETVPSRVLTVLDRLNSEWRAAKGDSWYLRQDVIWHKPNPMPESCRDRCTKAHEYLFLLTKKPRYFCDMEAVKEPARYGRSTSAAGFRGGFYVNNAAFDNTNAPKGVTNTPGKGGTRNKRSVWTIATAPYKEAHFATFPPKLIEPCVLAGTSAKGCCPECGKPWVRVVEKTKTFESGSGKSGNPISGKNGPECQGGGDTGDIRKGPCISSVTTGWEPGCECHGSIQVINIGPDGEDLPPGGTYGSPIKTRKVYMADENLPQPIPCIVFDPFMGSGTTGMVARQNGRDYLGLELNPEYIELIHRRIATADPAPTPLFEGLK